jgi:hypothetical protein
LASAFKTRVDPSVSGQASGQSGALIQNVSGHIYNSESDFTLAIPGDAPAGLANFGTRVKAVFRNVPRGERLFVSLTNVTVDPSTGAATGQVANSSASFAQLVRGETSPFSIPMSSTRSSGTNIELLEITPTGENRSATAVWEVVNTQRSAMDTLQFGVFISSNAAHVGSGSATVDLSYAPTSIATEEEESAVVPRFAAGSRHPAPLIQCRGNRQSERE